MPQGVPADLGKGIPGKEADTILAAVSLLHWKMERGPGPWELTAERPGLGLSLQWAGVWGLRLPGNDDLIQTQWEGLEAVTRGWLARPWAWLWLLFGGG